MSDVDNIETSIAAKFKALGDPTRLRIFEFLRNCCCPIALNESGDVSPVIGPTVGEVCCRITGAERATSTISFHLKELRHAGLIFMQRRGKHILCGVNQKAVEQLNAYLLGESKSSSDDCCE
jgi:ArsR family transcriptional regulator